MIYMAFSKVKQLCYLMEILCVSIMVYIQEWWFRVNEYDMTIEKPGNMERMGQELYTEGYGNVSV